ncbi:MAG: hypothetical protein CME28_08180 [Gemmatimonadetes bacterium]|nr:hypothetical protein [Gemmatimonadota bacterium]|tara:strand:- start:964 stop:1479 length:516 start_codon:yes stop_codon:yes gene_type:complete
MIKSHVGKKLYYSISEVAEITDLQPYTLRAWEKEFTCLRPRRARGKNRAYRGRDIGIVLLIKQLLYQEGYTTKGVKQKLKNEPELIRSTTFNPSPNDPGLVADNSPGDLIHSRDGDKIQVHPVSIKRPLKDDRDEVESQQNAQNLPLASKSEHPNPISQIKKELREILELL